ncbi:hypothetical protein MesoLjLc_58930 [Mesorhizobium sp. L-8-10]|uniref:hypothetical protein n=1 Tax=Mesorhizobium sp. L-8-10 TaxID=2744523 RepID=UPI001925D74A|nr:hypothetical protein [Mesorhizobium sp. L-8-10]BCH33963.1 hypothetical protein MesoLjLc_58930 [Mesorhizobium sp. L-8-10]
MDWQKERKKRQRYEKHRADTTAQIDMLVRQIQEGVITGQRVDDPEILREVRQAARRSIDTRYNPVTTYRNASGQLVQRGVGGAEVPAMPDLLTREDVEADWRSQKRYAKSSKHLWNSYRVEHPTDDPTHVQQACQALVSQSGMSMDELSDLADDETVRDSLFETIHETTNAVRAGLATAPSEGDDLRTAGLGDFGNPSATASKPAEKSGSLSNDLREWQKTTGLYRGDN